ncbi:hypothetical protein BAUCODRAFT_149039 [Baudoinia panamericana UAMH 10762]|uniref:protein disulfide-isomerase n=1 Tax=Baudoinia panamericana (strain UAMH 10762) TaxID=717646 RepID=M2N886_BAUPA|nr:uncharacterized protein BAUCODRAFT_149039 [Baudoinia panamericana UAMH 10762]EMC95005.1 hypothetical protein BAUCODRAFT_149039 [Baudoinia panamericana UAMH 10762]
MFQGGEAATTTSSHLPLHPSHLPPPTMLLSLTLTTLLLLLLPSTLAAGLYTTHSPVLQLDGTTYHSLIASSNHTAIVEFYAPWCGHCKNLAPAYEKAAKSLSGLAKVGAVNCDAEENKPFCGSMGVQGFPTLKIVRPGKKAGRPVVEDYQGPRSAKGIVEAVVEKIPNHVRRLKDGDYQGWLEEGEGPKAILFSDKGSVSALLKAIAVDFLGSISVAQMRDKERQAVQVFNVDKFPTLVLLPGDGKDPIHYDGEMKKEAMVAFLSQAAPPNPDPAPKEKKKKSTKSSTTDKSKASRASSTFSKASAADESSKSQSAKASQTAETLEDEPIPTATTNPDILPEEEGESTERPIRLPDPAPPIPTLSDELSLQHKCLNSKAGTCILSLLPNTDDTSSSQAITSLSEIHHKHAQASRPLFPFYALPASNPLTTALRSALSLEANTLALIATNGKRSWYRLYTPPNPTSFSQVEIENWIDAIRMGDLSKSALPEHLIPAAEELPPLPAAAEAEAEAEPIKIDLSDPETLRKVMSGEGTGPGGVQFEMEEVGDGEYERIVREARERAEAREAREAREAEGRRKGEEAAKGEARGASQASYAAAAAGHEPVAESLLVEEHDEL